MRSAAGRVHEPVSSRVVRLVDACRRKLCCRLQPCCLIGVLCLVFYPLCVQGIHESRKPFAVFAFLQPPTVRTIGIKRVAIVSLNIIVSFRCRLHLRVPGRKQKKNVANASDVMTLRLITLKDRAYW